jgi:hypothetical protein
MPLLQHCGKEGWGNPYLFALDEKPYLNISIIQFAILNTGSNNNGTPGLPQYRQKTPRFPTEGL